MTSDVIEGHISLFLFLALKRFYKFCLNSNPIKTYNLVKNTKINMKDTNFPWRWVYPLIGHERSYKAHLAKFFLAHSFINQLQQKLPNTNNMKMQFLLKMKYWIRPRDISGFRGMRAKQPSKLSKGTFLTTCFFLITAFAIPWSFVALQ